MLKGFLFHGVVGVGKTAMAKRLTYELCRSFGDNGANDRRADEVVMVGDSWAADVLGARAAGIRAIWFNPDCAPSPEPGAGVVELHALEPVDAAVAKIFAGEGTRSAKETDEGRNR